MLVLHFSIGENGEEEENLALITTSHLKAICNGTKAEAPIISASAIQWLQDINACGDAGMLGFARKRHAPYVHIIGIHAPSGIVNSVRYANSAARNWRISTTSSRGGTCVKRPEKTFSRQFASRNVTRWLAPQTRMSRALQGLPR